METFANTLGGIIFTIMVLIVVYLSIILPDELLRIMWWFIGISILIPIVFMALGM